MEDRSEKNEIEINEKIACFPELEMGLEIPESERMDEKEIQKLLNNTAPDDDY